MIRDTFHESKIKDGFKFVFDNGLFYFSVRYGSENILIFINSDINLTEEEYDISENIGHLIGYYLNKLEFQFIKVFKDCSIDAGNIEVSVFSDNYVKRSLIVDNNLSGKVNSESPIYFQSSLNKDILDITTIYSIEYIDNLYNPNTNCYEQFVIKELISSIYFALKPNLSKDQVSKKAKEFIDINIPDGKPGFNLEKLIPIHERLIKYSSPLELSESSENRVKKLIGNFLKNILKVNPGKYSGNNLKKILNKTYEFLQSELEKEIRTFNQSLLYFTYAQFEFLRNYRESNEINLGRAQKSYIEYDINEKKVELLNNTVMRNNVFQHMIETILKVNSHVGANINIKDFQYLEALTTQAYDLAFISDFIHWKVIPYEMILKKDYSFNLDEKKTFYGDEYLINQSKKGLKYDFEKYERSKKDPTDYTGERKLDPRCEGLERAFKMEFGFKYTELLIITFVLGTHINPANTDFYPLIYLDQDSLVKEIKDVTIDDIPDETIIKVLNFISLRYDTFKKQDPFLPNTIRMNENRFSIKPLIKLIHNGKTYYLYGVLAVFVTCGIYSYNISTGHFPYQLKKGEITKELKKIEKLHNRKLEIKVDKLASDIFGSENVVSNLKKFKNIDKSLPNTPECGEIDCLVIDKTNEILYVLEAKDVTKALVPIGLRTEFNKFFDPEKKKNHSKQLMKKVKFVSEHLGLFLKYFKVLNTKNWKIKHAFVTYEVHLSAFHKVNDIEFIPLTELENYFQNEI